MQSEGDNNSGKPRLDREVLEGQGIAYIERVYEGQILRDLPEHVSLLREALLDFAGLFEASSGPFFEDEYQYQMHNARLPINCGPPPDSSYFETHGLNTRLSERNAAIALDELNRNSNIAQEANRLEERRTSEDEWVHFLRNYIFLTFEKSQEASSGRSPYGELFDRWSIEQNLLWRGSVDRNVDLQRGRPTLPKPDLTFAFPIIEQSPETSKGLWRDESAKNFTVETLRTLYRDECFNLKSSPKGNLGRLQENGNNASDLVCFPWAVVEVKRVSKEQSADFCYCQAANAASYALQLYEELVEKSTDELDDGIPLVVSFTTIGPQYKVWLAYSLTKEYQTNCHKMVCIWEHSMASTWGLIALQHIVKNMHLWASRVLRPRISNYITQCRKKLAQNPSVDDRSADATDSPSQVLPAVESEPSATLRKGKSPQSVPNQDHTVTNSSQTSTVDLMIALPPPRFRSDGAAKPKHDLPSDVPVTRTASDENRSGCRPNCALGETLMQSSNAARDPSAIPVTAGPSFTRDISASSANVQSSQSTTCVIHTANEGCETEIPTRPRSAPSLTGGGDFDQAGEDSDLLYYVTPPSSENEMQRCRDLRPYHVYRLEDHEDRWDTWSDWSDPESDESDGQSYVPSETSSEELEYWSSASSETESGADYPYTPSRSRNSSPPALSDPESRAGFIPRPESNVLTDEIIDELGTKALDALVGAQFISLRAVKPRIESLTGERLFDAVWRALEWCLDSDLGPYAYLLEEILSELGSELALPPDEPLSYRHIMAGRNREWEMVDKALQEMQKRSVFRMVLTLKKALSLWSGDACLEILEPELEDMLDEERASMKRQALNLLHSGRFAGCRAIIMIESSDEGGNESSHDREDEPNNGRTN